MDKPWSVFWLHIPYRMISRLRNSCQMMSLHPPTLQLNLCDIGHDCISSLVDHFTMHHWVAGVHVIVFALILIHAHHILFCAHCLWIFLRSTITSLTTTTVWTSLNNIDILNYWMTCSSEPVVASHKFKWGWMKDNSIEKPLKMFKNDFPTQWENINKLYKNCWRVYYRNSCKFIMFGVANGATQA